MFEVLFYAILPYIAITTFIIGSLYRFYNDRFSISSQSSQFLGDKSSLLIGSYAWHWSISLILLVHALGIFFLAGFKWLISDRSIALIFIYEYIGLFFSGFAVIGISVLMVRRLRNPRLRVVTTWIDWLIFTLLLIQVTLGWWVAFDSLVLNNVPGSIWFASTIVPWFISIFTFDPIIGGISSLNWFRQFHFVNGMLIFTIFPFSRLSHMLSYPFQYFYRNFQIIIWNNKVKRRPRITVRKEE